MTRFLGIDLGTTFLKGAVLDLESCQLCHVHREPFPDPIPNLPIGHCEFDPTAIVNSARKLIGELLSVAPDATGLLVSSQMHCLVFTDHHGNPSSNVMTWKDQRGMETHPSGGTYLDRLREQISDAMQIATGRELRLGIPIVTLAWLAEKGRIPEGAVPASLPDFVIANLCGTTPTTEPTHASATGLFHLASNDWHHELIDSLGWSGLRWPSIMGTGKPVGQAIINGKKLTCYAPIGDQQCSLLGAGLGDHELSVNISTGSQVSIRSDTLHAGDFLVRPYSGGGWLNTVVQVPAGRSLTVLVNLLTELGDRGGDTWSHIARVTERAAETDLQVDLGFFGGPFGNHGSITNITEHNLNVANLFTAAFRTMAENYAKCANRLATAGKWDRVVFSGGLAHTFAAIRSATLRAIGANNLRVCPHSEDTLAGLLTLGLVASGRAASVAEATKMVQETSGM